MKGKQNRRSKGAGKKLKRDPELSKLMKEIKEHIKRTGKLTNEELYNLLEKNAPSYLKNDDLYDQLLTQLQEEGINVIEEDEELDELSEEVPSEVDEKTISELRELSEDHIFLKVAGELDYRDNRSFAEVMQKYLNVVSKNPVLTQEQEIELIKRIKAGDKEAKEQFVRSNLALVINIAKKYYSRRGRALRISLAELVQEGIIGLLKALERFDISKKTKFSTYATWWIKQHISKYIQDNVRIGTLPSSIQDILSKYSKVRSKLTAKLGREPTIDEMIDEMYPNLLQQVIDELSQQRGIKLSENDTEVQYEYKRRRKELRDKISHLLSLINLKEISIDDKKYEDSSSTTEDFIPDEGVTPEEITEKKQAKERLLKALSEVLDEKERRIIIERYGLLNGRPKTLEELSVLMGISRERVRQIEERAIRKLKASKIVRNLRDLIT